MSPSHREAAKREYQLNCFLYVYFASFMPIRIFFVHQKREEEEEIYGGNNNTFQSS